MSDQGPTYIWEQINRYYQATRKPIHLAVAYTADAAAASLTLSSLLKASLIAYDIQPVATNEELTAMVASANLAQEYAQLSDTDPLIDEFFLLVGLGGAIPLSAFFTLERHVVVVLDACRPFHLSNLRQQDDVRLMVWGSAGIREEVDGFFRTQREAAARHRRRHRRRSALKRRKRLRRQYGVSAGDGDDDEHGDDASSSSDRSSSSDDVSDGDDDEDDDSVTPSQSQERVDWMNEEDMPPYLETAYYACERAGRSCAVEAHDLAVLLNRYRDTTLWHAAVGVCDLFNRRLMDYGSYLVEMRPLHDAVSLQKSLRRGGSGAGGPRDAFLLAAEEESRAAGGGGELDGHDEYLRKRSSNAMTLHNRNEEQLHLLRHTSLWDAIWQHPVTASVLHLHRVENGEGLLRELLARCGVSVKVAQQPWCEVPHDDKAESLRLVQEELRRYVESRAKFLTFPNEIRCISRTSGYSTEVSTFDACTLHDALLAAVPPASALTLEANFTGDAAAAQRTVAQRLRDFHRGQFWKAHAILDMDASAPAFSAAVEDATALQRAVAVATSALMQPGMVQSTTGLHYTIPSDPTRTTTALESFFTLPRLNALARRLLLTLTAERGLGRYTRAVRPLLVSCALPRPVREEADTSFAAFYTTLSSGSGGAQGTTLREVPMNALPFSSAGAVKSGAATSSHSGGGIPHSFANASTQDMLFSAAASAGMTGVVGGASGGGGGGGFASEEPEFMVLLLHDGARGSAMGPIASVGRFMSCIRDREEFDALPEQRFPAQRSAVVVADRATAAHLSDIMYLACLSSRWNPQREYLAALAEAQEAQQPDGDDEDDEDECDDEDESRYFDRGARAPSPPPPQRETEGDDDDSRGPISVA